jgi:Ankyrin repeats (3 copies)
MRGAAKMGQAGIVRLLLKDGKAHPAAGKNDALVNAARWGHLEIVKLLLSIQPRIMTKRYYLKGLTKPRGGHEGTFVYCRAIEDKKRFLNLTLICVDLILSLICGYQNDGCRL